MGAPAVKSDLYSWESTPRGKLEMGSAPPWVHFLTILCTSYYAIPLSTNYVCPVFRYLLHLIRRQSSLFYDGAYLVNLSRARCSFSYALPPVLHSHHKPPHAAHNPLLSCDGGRLFHGRATLLLSGRLEAYDKFRWRAGRCRGSLAAVLCVVGPQGRQIAPPRSRSFLCPISVSCCIAKYPLPGTH